MDLSNIFCPAVASWFAGHFATPTPAQLQAWPAIRADRHMLIAAPTGSGKTLAAFLAAIDGLVRQALEARCGRDQVVYVSPLKALSNDIQRNLEVPLAGIRESSARAGCRTSRSAPGCAPAIRPPANASACAGGRRILSSRRRSHFTSCSAPNRAARCWRRRAPSSSTKFMPWRRTSAAAISRCRWNVWRRCAADACSASACRRRRNRSRRWRASWSARAATCRRTCAIVDTGHHRARELRIEVPDSPLEAVMSAEVWQQVYDRLAELVEAHRTTLMFVNTRRMAERVARHLSERLGEEQSPRITAAWRRSSGSTPSSG